MESMGINKSFWKNRRIFLTGHTGFKGGWLAHWLRLMNATVCGFALAPSTIPSFFDLTHLDKYVQHIVGDIRDEALLKKTIAHFDPEIIIHMAAQPLVLPSYESPLETFSVNAIGTANVLEAARYAKSTKVILIITSDKCYENNGTGISFCETNRLGGHDPYSNSKACAELITQCFRDSFFNKRNIAVATARAGNVIGGGDWSEYRLIPDIIRSLSQQKPFVLRHPNAVRPWQHVLEPLSGYLQLIEKCFSNPHQYSSGWNFGPADAQSHAVKTVVKKFQEKMQDVFKYQVIENTEHQESQQLRLNIDKALHQLQWMPKYTIEDSIQKTADWYHAWINHEEMKTFTEKQITDYMK